MTVQLDLHTEEILSRLSQSVSDALDAAGQVAVTAVQQQMLSGYARPIRDTGALMESITYALDGSTVHIGTPLPYAEAVHDGTARTSGRPFLTDGLRAAPLAEALAEALNRHFP